jgi:hypothetical protein
MWCQLMMPHQWRRWQRIEALHISGVFTAVVQNERARLANFR